MEQVGWGMLHERKADWKRICQKYNVHFLSALERWVKSSGNKNSEGGVVLQRGGVAETMSSCRAGPLPRVPAPVTPAAARARRAVSGLGGAGDIGVREKWSPLVLSALSSSSSPF